MAKMDPTTQQQIIAQITTQIIASLQLQQKEQMKEMQEELDKMKELLGKRNHESVAKVEMKMLAKGQRPTTTLGLITAAQARIQHYR